MSHRMGRPKIRVGHHGSMRASEISAGRWTARCRYGDEDGVSRQVSAQANTEKEALKNLREKLRERPDALGGDLRPGSTVAELAADWLGSLDQSQLTQDTYRSVTARHVIPVLGNVKLRDATTGRLDRFLQQKHTEGRSIAKSCKVVLSLMFSRAVRHDALTHNPVTETRLPRDRRRLVTAMSMCDLRGLRADVAEWAGKRSDRAVVLDMLDLFVATGLRPGELMALRHQDIDLRNGTLAVTGTVKRDSVHGLHRQEYTKTISGMRVLHLPSWAVSILRRRKLASASDLVFPNADGNLMEPNNFRRRWRAARGPRWADVELRAFRRSVATLIEREYGAVVASQQLGHSNVEVTRRHYIQRATDTPDSSSALDSFRR